MPRPVSTGKGDQLWFVTGHSGQLSLLPSTGQKMSTSQCAVMLCGCTVKAGMVDSSCGQTSEWQVKLSDPSLTRAIPERFRDEFLIIKCHTNLRLLHFMMIMMTLKMICNDFLVVKVKCSSSVFNIIKYI